MLQQKNYLTCEDWTVVGDAIFLNVLAPPCSLFNGPFPILLSKVEIVQTYCKYLWWRCVTVRCALVVYSLGSPLTCQASKEAKSTGNFGCLILFEKLSSLWFHAAQAGFLSLFGKIVKICDCGTTTYNTYVNTEQKIPCNYFWTCFCLVAHGGFWIWAHFELIFGRVMTSIWCTTYKTDARITTYTYCIYAVC